MNVLLLTLALVAQEDLPPVAWYSPDPPRVVVVAAPHDHSSVPGEPKVRVSARRSGFSQEIAAPVPTTFQAPQVQYVHSTPQAQYHYPAAQSAPVFSSPCRRGFFRRRRFRRGLFMASHSLPVSYAVCGPQGCSR